MFAEGPSFLVKLASRLQAFLQNAFLIPQFGELELEVIALSPKSLLLRAHIFYDKLELMQLLYAFRMPGLGITDFFLILICILLERVNFLEELCAFLEHLLLFLLE